MPGDNPRKLYMKAEAGSFQLSGSPAKIRWGGPGVSPVEADIPLPHDHELYGKIGQIASQWAHIEHTLDLLIWGLGEIPPDIGACITGQMVGAYPRFRSLYSICLRKKFSPDTLKKIMALMNDANKHSEARNRAVHDPWFIRTTDNQVSQFVSMSWSKKEFGLIPVTIDTLDKISREMSNYQKRIDALKERLLSEAQTLAGKPQP